MTGLVSILRALAGKVVVPQMERRLRRFEALLPKAASVQRDVLFHKIRRCADSQFGRDHRFSRIRTIDDFRRQVPIAGYEYYQPYVRQVAQGRVEAMFPAGEQILMFTVTSGTTAEPKMIPVNRPWMDEYRRGWQIWGIRAFLDHPALFYAKLAGMAGNWNMWRAPSGIPCGLASGLSARLQSPLLRMVYCIPPSVHEIEDSQAKYYAAIRLAVPERAGLLMAATPSTLLKFSRLADQFAPTLIRDIRDGTLSDAFAVPEHVRREVDRRIRAPNPARARQLEGIVERTGHLFPKDFWELSLAACWLGGTVGTDARRLPEYLGDIPCRDIGLLCSEGRFTIPIEDGTPAGLLEIASHYYEFIPEEEVDSAHPTVLECHELEVGRNYFILPTTSSGLYRYHIYDVVRCTGRVGQTPLLEFLNKGQRFSDMEGEKLGEFHFVQAVGAVCGNLGARVSTFTAVPVRPSDGSTAAPYYAILVEEQDLADRAQALRFLEGVDRWLAEHNVMYQGKRADQYLGSPRLIRIPSGSLARFDQEEIRRRGVGEDHYKHPCLVLDPHFLDRFQRLEEVANVADSR